MRGPDSLSESDQPADDPIANLTSSPDSPRALMMPRLETVLRSLGPDVSVDEVLSVLDAYPPTTSIRCLNPKCSNICFWPDGGGRPQAYCRPSCRVECLRDWASLRAQEAALADLSELDASVRKRRIIERRLALTRWLLSRYPVPDESDGAT